MLLINGLQHDNRFDAVLTNDGMPVFSDQAVELTIA